MKRITFALALAATITGTTAAEESKFLQLSLTPDIALQSRETTIEGISLNIWGEGPQSGFTMGFVNGNTGESKGFTMGLVNYAETYKGVQWGIVNISSKLFAGWQSGLVNIGKEVHGLQWGTVNYAESLNGLQLGLVCIVKENSWFEDFPDQLAKGFVFLNWSF
jgi:hypothetical protein